LKALAKKSEIEKLKNRHFAHRIRILIVDPGEERILSAVVAFQICEILRKL